MGRELLLLLHHLLLCYNSSLTVSTMLACRQSVSQLVLEHGGQFNDLKSINNTMDALQWANKNVGNVSELVENGLTWLDSRCGLAVCARWD